MSKNNKHFNPVPFSFIQSYVFLLEPNEDGNYYGELEITTLADNNLQYQYSVVRGDSVECYRRKTVIATEICKANDYTLPVFHVEVPESIQKWIRNKGKCLQIYRLMRNEI